MTNLINDVSHTCLHCKLHSLKKVLADLPAFVRSVRETQFAPPPVPPFPQFSVAYRDEVIIARLQHSLVL